MFSTVFFVFWCLFVRTTDEVTIGKITNDTILIDNASATCILLNIASSFSITDDSSGVETTTDIAFNSVNSSQTVCGKCDADTQFVQAVWKDSENKYSVRLTFLQSTDKETYYLNMTAINITLLSDTTVTKYTSTEAETHFETKTNSYYECAEEYAIDLVNEDSNALKWTITSLKLIAYNADERDNFDDLEKSGCGNVAAVVLTVAGAVVGGSSAVAAGSVLVYKNFINVHYSDIA